MHGRYLLAVLTPLLLAGPVSAAPVTVFTQIWEAAGNSGAVCTVDRQCHATGAGPYRGLRSDPRACGRG